MGVSAVLVFLLVRNIGLERIGEQITQAAWQGVLLSLLVFIISNFLGALQWYLLLQVKKIKISFKQALSYYHVGLFFNNFLIGNVGGDALRILDVRRQVGKDKGVLSTVFFDRFTGFFALSSLALLSAWFVAHRLVAGTAVYTILVIFLLWFAAILFMFYKKFARLFAWIFRLLLPESLHVKAKAFYDSINEFRTKKRLLLHVYALSLLIQTLRILTHYLAARAVGAQAGLHYFFLFIPIVATIASMPISIGGLGVREQSAVALFSQINVPSAQTVTFEFLAYLIGIVASLPGGLVFILRREYRHDKDRQEDHDVV